MTKEISNIQHLKNVAKVLTGIIVIVVGINVFFAGVLVIYDEIRSDVPYRERCK